MKLFLLLNLIFFLNARAETAGPIPFDTALQQIVDRSTAVGIAQQNLEATRARNVPSRIGFLPKLSLEAKDSYSSVTAGTVDPDMPFADGKNEIRTLSATAEMNVFKFGADGAAFRAADAENSAGQFDLDDSVLKAETSGTKALIAVIGTERGNLVLKQIVEMQEQLVSMAQERYKKGLLAQQEVDKLVIDLDNARASLRDGEVELARAKAELTALLGNHDIEREWPWKNKLETKPFKIDANYELLAQRPDWKAAERRAEASRGRTNQSWGKILPSLDVRFSYNHINVVSRGVSGPSWDGALVLSIPLFDRLVNYSDYREKVANQTRTEIELEQVRRQARSDWDSVREAFRITLETAKSRDVTLATSRKIYGDSLKRFKAGLMNANDLSVDRNRLYSTELLAVKGWSAVHLVFSDLCHAQGHRLRECLAKL